jgi:hypothetical protein
MVRGRVAANQRKRAENRQERQDRSCHGSHPPNLSGGDDLNAVPAAAAIIMSRLSLDS